MARRSAEEPTMIEVTVLRSGGRPQRVEVADDATAQEAIDESGFTVKDGDSVTINGDAVEASELDSMTIEDADQIVISAKFEGGR